MRRLLLDVEAHVMHVAHAASTSDPLSTSCGEPWQGWQAPKGLAEARARAGGGWPAPLPPHQPGAAGVPVRFCGACARIVIEAGVSEGMRRGLNGDPL